MKKNLEQILIASRIDEDNYNDNFVAKTMRVLKTTSANETFLKTLRRTKTKKGIAMRLLTRIRQLPATAAIVLAILSLGSTAGVAYAAYYFLFARVTIVSTQYNPGTNKYIYTVKIGNCGQVVGGSPIGNGVNRFEVAANSGLNNQQVKSVLENTCNYQSLLQFENNNWPGTSGKISKGELVKSYLTPNGQIDIGRISSLSNTSITIQTYVYMLASDVAIPVNGQILTPSAQYFPNGKILSSTYQLASNREVWIGGTKRSINELKVGDIVSLIPEEQYVAQSNNDYETPSSQPQVVGIVKTNINTQYVQGFGVSGNPKYVAPIAELIGCQNNGSYLCLTYNSEYLRGQDVYITSDVEGMQPNDGSQAQNGDAYMRKDITSTNNDGGKDYFTIEGRAVSLDNKNHKLILLTSGVVRKITVNMPYDVVDAYNGNNKTKLTLNDYVRVDYKQKTTEDHTVINAGDIVRISIYEYQTPDGGYIKY